MDNRLRARKAEDKEERRRVILDATLSLWQETSYTAFTMAELAKRTGLAKGTLFFYFSTKEQLFLSLLTQLLNNWFNEVDKRLDDRRGEWSVERVTRILHQSLINRTALTRLMTLLEGVIEHNIDFAAAYDFKQQMLIRLSTTAKKLEKRLPFLPPGEGEHLLLHIRALMGGLRQMADNSSVIKEIISQNKQMKVFQIDFNQELKIGISLLINGLHAHSISERKKS